MDKPEDRFFDRLAEITGANISKTASFSHAGDEGFDVFEKLASMSMEEIVDNSHFVNGFEAILAKRMHEIDSFFVN